MPLMPDAFDAACGGKFAAVYDRRYIADGCRIGRSLRCMASKWHPMPLMPDEPLQRAIISKSQFAGTRGRVKPALLSPNPHVEPPLRL